MNSTQKRYAYRIRELIDESEKIVPLAKSYFDNYQTVHYITDQTLLNSWLIRTQNIIETAFSNKSPHCKRFQELTKKNICTKDQITSIIGLLIGSLDDLENGFLLGQEFLIAGEIFDSVLEEAKHLLKAGYKDPAAVLGRVVLEDALKRLARLEQIEDTKKASALNDELKDKRYNKVQWREIQFWLDIGNESAHGNFTKFTEEQVKSQIEGIERFIASEFRT